MAKRACDRYFQPEAWLRNDGSDVSCHKPAKRTSPFQPWRPEEYSFLILTGIYVVN